LEKLVNSVVRLVWVKNGPTGQLRLSEIMVKFGKTISANTALVWHVVKMSFTRMVAS